MKVLLTGASGFLGMYTYRQLVEAGHVVVPLDRRASQLPQEIVRDVAELSVEDWQRVVAELDAVIHLAALVDFSDAKAVSLIEANTLPTVRLAAAAKARDVRLLFASSITVQGKRAQRVGANWPDQPDSAYAMSKWVAERILADLAPSSVWLRCCGLFGLNGPVHLGLNRAIMAALCHNRPPEVRGRGRARRNYLYVKDAARWLVHALENSIAGPVYVGGPESTSIAEMMSAVGELCDPAQEPRYLDGEEAEDQICEISSGGPSLTSFRDALSDIRGDHETGTA